jgi:hypothetical protein
MEMMRVHCQCAGLPAGAVTAVLQQRQDVEEGREHAKKVGKEPAAQVAAEASLDPSASGLAAGQPARGPRAPATHRLTMAEWLRSRTPPELETGTIRKKLRVMSAMKMTSTRRLRMKSGSAAEHGAGRKPTSYGTTTTVNRSAMVDSTSCTRT